MDGWRDGATTEFKSSLMRWYGCTRKWSYVIYIIYIIIIYINIQKISLLSSYAYRRTERAQIDQMQTRRDQKLTVFLFIQWMGHHAWQYYIPFAKLSNGKLISCSERRPKRMKNHYRFVGFEWAATWNMIPCYYYRLVIVLLLSVLLYFQFCLYAKTFDLIWVSLFISCDRFIVHWALLLLLVQWMRSFSLMFNAKDLNDYNWLVYIGVYRLGAFHFIFLSSCILEPISAYFLCI